MPVITRTYTPPLLRRQKALEELRHTANTLDDVTPEETRELSRDQVQLYLDLARRVEHQAEGQHGALKTRLDERQALLTALKAQRLYDVAHALRVPTPITNPLLAERNAGLSQSKGFAEEITEQDIRDRQQALRGELKQALAYVRASDTPRGEETKMLNTLQGLNPGELLPEQYLALVKGIERLRELVAVNTASVKYCADVSGWGNARPVDKEVRKTWLQRVRFERKILSLAERTLGTYRQQAEPEAWQRLLVAAREINGSSGAFFPEIEGSVKPVIYRKMSMLDDNTPPWQEQKALGKNPSVGFITYYRRES